LRVDSAPLICTRKKCFQANWNGVQCTDLKSSGERMLLVLKKIKTNFSCESAFGVAITDTIYSVLKEILTSSKDPNVIAIACFDIGEFARFHPRGKM
jgi:hypothetical protein